MKFQERSICLFAYFACFFLLALLSSHVNAVEPPKLPEHEFTFVVVGDSQLENSDVFNPMVEEIALLYPSFVVQVGDLIQGYTDDVENVKTQWARFKNQIAPLGDIPFFPVPGNHDVHGADAKTNPDLERLYQEMWGELYHSFDYRNAHFVILDTDYRNEMKRIGPEQFRWLETDLEENRDKEHIFVFFHHPLVSLENADQLHQLFTKYPVKVVFYGHWHHYQRFERDGIQYVMTNASGDMGTDVPQAGSFFHFIVVTVRDDQFRFGLVKAGSVQPPDGVWPEDNDGIFQLRRKALAVKKLAAIDLTKTEGGYNVTLTLNNPTDQDLWVQFQWDLPDRRWRIRPNRGSRLILRANAKNQTVPFTLVRTDGSAPEDWPSCQLSIPYLTKNGEWVTTIHDFRIE